MAASVSTTAVFVLAAVSAMMSFSVMMPLTVVAAPDIRVIGQISCKERFYRLVRISGNAAVQIDPGICQGIFRAHADAAADQRIHTHVCQKTCQRAVAASVRVNDLSFAICPFSTS